MEKIEFIKNIFNDFIREVASVQDETGSVITSNLYLENALNHIINLIPKNNLVKKHKTFYEKIQLINYLGIFKDRTKQNLEAINSIRNSFAHNITDFNWKRVRAKLKQINFEEDYLKKINSLYLKEEEIFHLAVCQTFKFIEEDIENHIQNKEDKLNPS